MGQIEIVAHARLVDGHALGHRGGVAQRARGERQDLRQRQRLALPRAGRTLVIAGDRAQHQRHQGVDAAHRRQHMGALHRIALLRQGAGTAAARLARLGEFRHLGLHQQDDVAGEFAEAAADQAEETRDLGHALAIGVPRRLGQGQAELRRQRLGDGAALIAQGGERAGRAAELHGKIAAFQLFEAREMIGQRREPDRAFVAEGDRQRLLQEGAPRHRQIAVPPGLSRQRIAERQEIAGNEIERVAQLQHQRGIGHVLGGGAPMDIGRGRAAGGLAQRLGQRRHRLAGERGALGHPGQRQIAGLGRLDDGGGRRLGNDAEPGLDAGQRRLDFEHEPQPVRVREQLAHLRRAVEPAVDFRIRRIDRHAPPRRQDA